EGRIRWIGIFSDPNDLGLTILAFTPLAIVKLFEKGSSLLRRGLWVIPLVLLIYALYLTNSRGTFIGLLAVLTMLMCRKIGLLKGMIIGSLFSAVILIAGPSRMSDMSLDEASASGRIDAWATGLNLLIWRPLLGVGFRNFTEHHHLTAHNSVVLCMSELGLAGLFVWLAAIVSSFVEMVQVERKAAGTRFAHYAEIMQLSLTGFFVSAFFLSRTYNEVLFILIAISALLSWFARKRFEYKVPLFSPRLMVWTLIFMVGLIAVIKILVSV
ncbi:MAG TPA: O-antigen ligase family protein, partial [Candidatus Krumholzibacterium sp.]|nr:O-antigen ligase family protein [Candidatus Krumholzibacterium sp.]